MHAYLMLIGTMPCPMVWPNPRLQEVATVYFFVNILRFAVYMWLPIYLHTVVGYGKVGKKKKKKAPLTTIFHCPLPPLSPSQAPPPASPAAGSGVAHPGMRTDIGAVFLGGDAVNATAPSPRLPVSPSPRLPVSPSPRRLFVCPRLGGNGTHDQVDAGWVSMFYEVRSPSTMFWALSHA